MDTDQLGSPVQDPRYAAALLGFTTEGGRAVVTPMAAVAAMGDLADEGLRADVFAALHRADGETLDVGVAAGWERAPGQVGRLLGLATEHPRLGVSLPPVADDDGAGRRSRDVLRAAADGADVRVTGTRCGVHRTRPPVTGPSLAGELTMTAQALDRLERVLRSPGWSPPPGR